MDAAVVSGGDDEVVHVRGLGVATQPRVVVCGARLDHRAQRLPLHPWEQQIRPDEPVGLRRGLPARVLDDEDAEHVGDVLVEGSGLAAVGQARGVLRDAVGQLVGDDVEAGGAAPEDHAVAVPEDHLVPVPEGVVVALSVVHGREEGQAACVEAVPAVHLEEEPMGQPQSVIRLVGGRIARRRLPLRAHGHAWQPGAALGVENRPACRPLLLRFRRSALQVSEIEAGWGRGGGRTMPSPLGVADQGQLGTGLQPRVPGRGERLEDVRRDDCATGD